MKKEYTYAVRMVATPDTYDYEVVELDGDEVHETIWLTFAQVRERWPELVGNNLDALVTLSERAAEIFK